VDRTRNPESMTADERRDEVASILARGMVRAVRLARARTSPVGEDPEKDGGTCLELSEEPRLSVAPRPAG